jgi:methylenetetrahydrofolate dehydrogenase (NADP+)/methenyltetrahydrofolate cyclohydrolase
MILSGKIAAQAIREKIAENVRSLERKPKLAVILVGENPASVAYVGQKRKACAEVGMAFELVELPVTASEAEVLGAVLQKNADAETDGIIVQLPLPG